MIDLHTHILPGIDDGAPDIETALAMARMAVADGIEVVACTPHFMPGLYDNESNDVRRRVDEFNQHLVDQNIPLAAVVGADAHVRPDFTTCLREGKILTLHDSRYVLVEPPHQTLPQRLDELLFNIKMAGFVPILTHPERLKWLEGNYDFVVDLARKGVWIQVTAGALTGRFGKRPQYWGQKFLAEGHVSILATDMHNLKSRPPLLAEAREYAANELGEEEANHLVFTRPLCILNDEAADMAPGLPEGPKRQTGSPGFWGRLFGSQQT